MVFLPYRKKCNAQASSVCINALLTKLEVKIAEYLPIFFFLRFLRTKTKSRFDERAEKSSGSCLLGEPIRAQGFVSSSAPSRIQPYNKYLLL